MNSLANKLSLLRISCNDMLNIFGSSAVTIFLYEPNDQYSFSVWTDSYESECFESTNTLYRDQLLKIFQKDQTPLVDEEDLCVPLCTDRTKVFGFAVMHGSGKPDTGPLSVVEVTALSSFASNLMKLTDTNNSFEPRNVVVDIKDLTVEYSTGHHSTVAVNGLNLKICEDEFTIVLGTSGCGKTSLLNAVGGMLHPKSGQVLYDGKDITKFRGSKATNYRKETVGFIFQQYNLISDLTAKENIEVAASLVKNPLSAKEVLDLVGLGDKANNYPGQMSGGEQQRVCIARALVKKPGLLLCDEPTGALDTNNAAMVMRILQDLVKKHNVPVVMITHNPEFAALADHYVLMSNGQIVEEYRQPFAKDAMNLVIR